MLNNILNFRVPSGSEIQWGIKITENLVWGAVSCLVAYWTGQVSTSFTGVWSIVLLKKSSCRNYFLIYGKNYAALGMSLCFFSCWRIFHSLHNGFLKTLPIRLVRNSPLWQLQKSYWYLQQNLKEEWIFIKHEGASCTQDVMEIIKREFYFSGSRNQQHF